MGMSSSQARLLSLTARQHDIEYKAQKLEAQKLQLANESDRVYDDYIRALDAKKMQYKAINSDGSTTFRDANLKILENGAVQGYTGETSNQTYLVQNAYNGDVYVTPEFAAAYGITGGDVQDPGDLDTWLANHGCTTEEVMKTVTDYSNVTGATPVENVVAKAPGTQTVSDANTYSITGTLATPTDNTVAGTTSYSVTGNTPTVSSTDPTPKNKTVVIGGTSVSGTENVNSTSNTEQTKYEYLIPANQTFNSITGYTYTINSVDKDLTMQQLSDKYGWNMDFSDAGQTSQNGDLLNTLTTTVKGNETKSLTSVYGLNVSGTPSSCAYTYIASTKLSDILQYMQSALPGVTYDNTTGVLTVANASSISFSSNDDYSSQYSDGTEQLETYLRQKTTKSRITSSSSFTVSSSTLLVDLLSSNAVSGDQYADFRIYRPNNGTYVPETYKYPNGTPPANWTIKNYLEYLKTVDELSQHNFTWWEDSDGIHSTIEDGYTISCFAYCKNMNGELIDEKTKTNSITVTLNKNAIAENIYLAQSIVAGTTSSDYSANHSSSISNILTQLASAYNNYTTDENKRQLTLFSELLTTAIDSNDKTQIQNALNQMGQTITSDKYQASGETTETREKSGNITNVVRTKNVNEVTYVFNDSSVSFTPSTTQVPDGTTPGTLTVNGSDDELKAYLAKSCYDANDSNTYEQYLSSINTNEYDTYQLAELVKNFSTYKSELIAGTDLKSSLTDYSASTHTLSQSANSPAYSVTNTSTSTEYKVSVASADDIADRLAYDIYVKNGSTGDPNTIKSTLGRTFQNSQLASLSYYYSDSAKWDDIVTKLAANMSTSSVSEYLNKYAGYTISYDTNSAVSINTKTNSHEEIVKGLVNIPELNGIASNLVAAFRKSGKTVTDADVLANLTTKYGTDNDTNNFNLANINKAVCEYLTAGSNANAIDNIYNVLFGSASLNVPSSYDSTQYNIARENLGTCTTTYGTKQEGTGVYQWVQDETYYDALESYNAAKALAGKKFVIVTGEQASSANFVNNLVLDYGCNLLKFDTSIDDMSGTSVSVETSLREVSDETDLKKAEAKYEADMKRIDRKDAKYDTQLAKLETERGAIKDEVETLKTVIKENAERTFKLFS